MPPSLSDLPTHSPDVVELSKKHSSPPSLTTLLPIAPKSHSLPTPESEAEQPTPKPSPESADPELSPEVARSEEKPVLETIDMETFRQILDLDEDGTREFSREMADAYFTQARSTFIEMDKALASQNLAKLSSLGHFLKGSSAALGISKVQASCEKIQHYGQLRDEEAGKDLTRDDALDKITQLLGQVKAENSVAKEWLDNWYAADQDGTTLKP